MSRRAQVAVLFALVLGAAACTDRPKPREPLREVCAPMPPCPSIVDAFRENKAALHVYVFDAVSGTKACTSGGTIGVTVYLDDVPVGLGEMPCAKEIRVPPAAYRIEGKPVVAGLHELRIEVKNAVGKMEASALMSLPAFDIAGEGKWLLVGAEVAVTVSADDIAISPPQVYAPKGL